MLITVNQDWFKEIKTSNHAKQKGPVKLPKINQVFKANLSTIVRYIYTFYFHKIYFKYKVALIIIISNNKSMNICEDTVGSQRKARRGLRPCHTLGSGATKRTHKT